MKYCVGLVAVSILLFGSLRASARDEIRIVGSSTVFPFSTAVAEKFGKKTRFRTPIVESTGSGGGLKLFCAGAGIDTPDITNSSRRIKESEVKRCSKNGVEDIIEIKIGFDGIVLANDKASKRFRLTKEQIFRALAKEIPIEGDLIANPYTKWSDIDQSLPNVKISVLGPPPTSGTRDAFVELAMEGGAKNIEMLASLRKKDKKAFKRIAHAIREDGSYVEAGENDNLIVQKLEASPDSLGIFGFSFLEQNVDRVQGSFVDAIEPTFENIVSGDYGISRSLYFYVKKANVGRIAGIEEFIREFTSEQAVGEEGYLADRGLIPLPLQERDKFRESSSKLANLKMQ